MKDLKDRVKSDKDMQASVMELHSRLKEASDGAKNHVNKHIETLYEETKNQGTIHHVKVPIIQKEVGQEVVAAPTSAQGQLTLVGEKEEEKGGQEAKKKEGEEVKQGEGEKEQKAEVVMVKEETKIEKDKEIKKGEEEEETLSTPTEVDGEEVYDSSIELDSILRRAPVIIFSKSYCIYSAVVKHILLEEFKLTPGPYIVELDLHPHGKELQELLKEKTGRSTVPNVLVNGRSLGGSDELKELRDERELAPILRRMGGKRLQVEQKNPEQ